MVPALTCSRGVSVQAEKSCSLRCSLFCLQMRVQCLQRVRNSRETLLVKLRGMESHTGRGHDRERILGNIVSEGLQVKAQELSVPLLYWLANGDNLYSLFCFFPLRKRRKKV
mgnify:CR=1 FL=1